MLRIWVLAAVVGCAAPRVESAYSFNGTIDLDRLWQASRSVSDHRYGIALTDTGRGEIVTKPEVFDGDLKVMYVTRLMHELLADIRAQAYRSGAVH